MEVKFDELYMALNRIDSKMRSSRSYSEEQRCYVVDLANLEGPINSFVDYLKKNGCNFESKQV